jgi:hypothetical protein
MNGYDAGSPAAPDHRLVPNDRQNNKAHPGHAAGVPVTYAQNDR